MNACINTNAAEFRALQERSGLSEFELKVAIRNYQNAHEGKWPELDEIPNVNSEESLRKLLKLNKNNSTKIKDILEATNAQSIEEAVILINNSNRDLNVEILPLKEDAIVTIEHRPSPFTLKKGEEKITHRNTRTYKVEQDDRSFYKGTITSPIFNDDGDMIIRAELNLDNEGITSSSVSMTSNLADAEKTALTQVEEQLNSYESEEIADKVKQDGYYLVQIDKDALTNKTVRESGEVKMIGDIKVPEGSYIVRRVYNNGEDTQSRGFITRREEGIELTDKRDLSVLNSQVFIGQSLEKLAKCFGIQTIYKTTDELKREGILDYVPEGMFVSAFILDGNIVVNLDVASVDAPVHELMHVLMGSIKYTQPDLYYGLVQTARQLESYEQRAALYQHRSQSDIDEEVFVEEYSKFLSGVQNEFVNLDPEIIYKLNYEISRTLDTILNGDNSVRAIPLEYRFGTTLRNLGDIVNSKNMESQYRGYVESAYISRVIGNIKEELFKSKQLEEIC